MLHVVAHTIVAETLALLLQLELTWPPELRHLMEQMSFLNINLELASPECSVRPWAFSYNRLVQSASNYTLYLTFNWPRSVGPMGCEAQTAIRPELTTSGRRPHLAVSLLQRMPPQKRSTSNQLQGLIDNHVCRRLCRDVDLLSQRCRQRT